MVEFLRVLEAVGFFFVVLLCAASITIIFIMLKENIFGLGGFNLIDFFLPSLIIILSIILLLWDEDEDKKNDISQKSHYEYYELKLSDDTIIRDSLQENNDYFSNDKGIKYYKNNIIYSKELNK